MVAYEQLWRQIPPEEKLELMAKAHSQGMFAAVSLVLTAATLAIGFQNNLIFWSAIIISPIVFQLSAGRKWKELKPTIMLYYLAARSAARRYAFILKGEDLDLKLIFRGKAVLKKKKEDKEEEVISQALDNIFNEEKKPVWIALFGDSVVVMSEHPGGAQLEFGALLNEKFKISSEEKEENKIEKIIMEYNGNDTYIELTSNFKVALLVFERKTRALLNNIVQERKERLGEDILSQD